jgi:hypothetical protein
MIAEPGFCAVQTDTLNSTEIGVNRVKCLTSTVQPWGRGQCLIEISKTGIAGRNGLLPAPVARRTPDIPSSHTHAFVRLKSIFEDNVRTVNFTFRFASTFGTYHE